MQAPPVPSIAAGNATFSTAMRAFHAWEAGELQDAVNAYESTRLLSTTATSTSSVLIGLGDKTFAIAAGLGFVAGQSVNVVSTANPANSMGGFVKSYTTTSLTVTVISFTGTGTIAAWSIALGLSGGGASLGTNTFTGAQNFAQGADIASAATINLTTATGNILNVTGVVATSIVTLGAGMTRLVRAAGAWPLTYNATTNNITGGASTILAAGDVVFYHNISGVVYGVIIKASGRSIIETSKIQPIAATIAANALTLTLNPTTLDFRDTVLSSGATFTVSNAAAISMVVPAGAQLGHTNAVLGRDTILAINAGGVMEVAVNFSGSGLNLDETGLITTEAITVGCTFTGAIAVTTGILTLTTGLTGALTLKQSISGTNVNSGTYVIALLTGVLGANGSTYSTNQTTAAASTTITGSAGYGIYSTTARTGVAYRVVGFEESTQATAGTWATPLSLTQGAGGQAAAALSSIGYGQTWQNVTASRVAGTTYYNTTGKPIQIQVSATWTDAVDSTATIDSLVVSRLGSNVAQTTQSAYSMIIPNGSSYSITGASASPFTAWYELR